MLFLVYWRWASCRFFFNDILDFSKIEAGKMDVESHPFELRPCIESALDLVRPRAIEKSVDLVLGIDETVPQTALDPGMAQRHPLRILRADDNLVNQKLALRLLQKMGYQADVAKNGIEALACIERQNYDAVLMDVQMPEMDGLEATRRIAARWLQSERPRSVAMTANAMQGDRDECLAAGMDDYVTKPIRVDALVASLFAARPQPLS